MYHFDIFHADRHLKIYRAAFTLMLDMVIPETCKKRTRNRKSLNYSLLIGSDSDFADRF